MKKLSKEEEMPLKKWFEAAASVATKSTCSRSKCGSVIVKCGIVIGQGYNSPPGNIDSQRRCSCDKTKLHKKVTDKTCCMHAEQRAIFEAINSHSQKALRNSTIFFVRIDNNGNILRSGKPYCTICSKLALDSGISNFVLWHKDGIYLYTTEEYNNLSYEY